MREPPPDLTELLRRVATGDRAAFSSLYAATGSKLYGIILRILKRRDLADDVLQEVYVKIWTRAADFDATRASPITWMATIARNRALDEVRRKQAIAIDDAPEAMNVADGAPLALASLEQTEDRRRLDACLARLEAERQAIVRHAYLNGWSREQLAAHYGHPVSTIKTWLHRSLKQLKDCLSA